MSAATSGTATAGSDYLAASGTLIFAKENDARDSDSDLYYRGPGDTAPKVLLDAGLQPGRGILCRAQAAGILLLAADAGGMPARQGQDRGLRPRRPLAQLEVARMFASVALLAAMAIADAQPPFRPLSWSRRRQHTSRAAGAVS